jgi:hypothetical protein
MDTFNEVSQADLDGESSYNLTESNLIKVNAEMTMKSLQSQNDTAISVLLQP